MSDAGAVLDCCGRAEGRYKKGRGICIGDGIWFEQHENTRLEQQTSLIVQAHFTLISAPLCFCKSFTKFFEDI
jgi:hypothetical protein